MIEFRNIPLAKIAMNTGQIEGLPANPRQWTQEELDKLAKSIKETPELLDARGAIVVPHKGKFVVLGGNMRVTAARKLDLKEMPCAVLPEDTAVKKLREIVIKDNSSMGAWDFDALANEWDDEPLTGWGVPAWDTKKEDIEAPEDMPDGMSAEGYVIKYEIIFDDELQQNKWYEFIAYLKRTYPECDTIAAKLHKHLTEKWQSN